DCVKPNAALETSPGAPTKLALHFVLGDKLGRAHRYVQEAVDLLIAYVRMHRAEVRSLGGDSESLRDCIDRRPDHRVIDWLGHSLAHEVHIHAPPAKRIEVVVGGLDGSGEIGPQRFDILHHNISFEPLRPQALIVSLSL